MSTATILSHLSPESLGEVSKLINQKTSVETVYFFPISFITLLFILYLLANVLHNLILPRAIGHKWHKDIKPEHRRTMVVYVLQILLTTVALVLQLAVAALLQNEFSVWRINVLRASACIIAALYVFELIYRYRMTYPMISHHAITCFAISLSLVMLEKLQDPSFALTGLLWIFQATTEQTCFVALFMYRLSEPVKVLRPLFCVSAVQSLVFKFASIGGTVWVWATYQRHGTSELSHAWTALFWTSTAGLAFSQVWGAWVVWKVGASLEKRYQQKREQEEAAQAKQTVPVLRRSESTMQYLHYGKASISAGTSRSPSMQIAACDLEKGSF
ncbi:hypothetical protein PSEUBRA_003218 [Kalmanozyma brasiliensis GHG001]|uniref:uncharacterized protein n=1 Tax=Kalmanozyma brasiliensis (strain GHG001) TaxID=1365824 RepID=UPI001CEA4F66|nr:uncharacterized protein PSEUBRA_003218 [Kalmanozyma brasiliensis GHG001]KAF6767200.1 hypothetical protein PSEUBRA_003218 [Kalmanozyma brasiliensis GHG001]